MGGFPPFQVEITVIAGSIRGS